MCFASSSLLQGRDFQRSVLERVRSPTQDPLPLPALPHLRGVIDAAAALEAPRVDDQVDSGDDLAEAPSTLASNTPRDAGEGLPTPPGPLEDASMEVGGESEGENECRASAACEMEVDGRSIDDGVDGDGDVPNENWVNPSLIDGRPCREERHKSGGVGLRMCCSTHGPTCNKYRASHM